MLFFPNCKINIGLKIISKRKDGYHNIETVFYPVHWCDILEINKRSDLIENGFSYKDGIAINFSGLNINDGSVNTCYTAYQVLKDEYSLGDIVLHLHKIIPAGAGLGGGSSNAAFVLTGLNRIFNLNLSLEELKSRANQIGSDCAFFIQNTPCIATGTGNQLSNISLSLSGLHIALVKPQESVSSAQAYKIITPSPSSSSSSLTDLIKLPVSQWKNFIVNDFEKEIFKSHPQIQNIKEALYESGCLYASMSGSGSCVYGLSDKRLDLDNKFNDCIKWQGIL